uniref:Uncharacterized protein n=1 Tax=Chenopodium quinoa TaxID=63459 RepID=A0A803M6F1_CHEQI
MDGIETQEVSIPMDISHPLIKGHDRSEITPILTQEERIGIVTQASSYETTTMSLLDAPVLIPIEVYYEPQNLLLSDVIDSCLLSPFWGLKENCFTKK